MMDTYHTFGCKADAESFITQEAMAQLIEDAQLMVDNMSSM